MQLLTTSLQTLKKKKKIQNTAPHQLLGRKLALSQPKPGQANSKYQFL